MSATNDISYRSLLDKLSLANELLCGVNEKLAKLRERRAAAFKAAEFLADKDGATQEEFDAALKIIDDLNDRINDFVKKRDKASNTINAVTLALQISTPIILTDESPKPKIRSALSTAVESTLANLGHPGKDVPWKVFCDAVRTKAGVDLHHRGFGDRNIRRALEGMVED